MPEQTLRGAAAAAHRITKNAVDLSNANSEDQIKVVCEAWGLDYEETKETCVSIARRFGGTELLIEPELTIAGVFLTGLITGLAYREGRSE